jgi:pimeloyl-ACP methyl ester carboxylesterase
MNQTVGFVRSKDGTRIAYAVAGSGPGRPLLRAATITSHIQLDQDSLVWGHFWRFLADGRTFVRYDGRGCGLSERAPKDMTLEARVADLEAVADEVDVESFDLLGHGIGAPVALEYLARHPDRVSKLILLFGFVRGPISRGLPMDSYFQILRGGGDSTGFSYDVMLGSVLVPDGSRERQQVCRDLIRASATAETVAALSQHGTDVDLTNRLPWWASSPTGALSSG